ARGAEVARIREQLGLDRPLWVQYAVFVHRLVHVGPSRFDPAQDRAHASCASIVPGLHVDFGKSIAQRKPVVALLGDRLPRTIAPGLLRALLLPAAAGRPGAVGPALAGRGGGARAGPTRDGRASEAGAASTAASSRSCR